MTAASLGAEYVEFDVQMTKDCIPVIYHDWVLSETGLKIPVSSITLAEFTSLGPTGNAGSSHQSLEKNQSDSSVRKSGRGLSLSALDDINHRHGPSDLNFPAKIDSHHHGGRGDVSIKAPFATLEQTLKVVYVNKTIR